jgi:CMP-N-acetylneuraminic acid synthetase
MSDFVTPRCVAVIPARGGSKVIPRKNLLSVGGVPLVVRTIRAALEAKRIERVVVSTDDSEIALRSETAGAEVISRPAEFATDEASSESALLHALQHLDESEGYRPELLAFLQCTSPLTLPEDIDGTIGVLMEQSADCAFTVTPSHHFLWQRASDGTAFGINHDMHRRLLKQSMGTQYLETGSVYAMRADGFRQAKHRFFGKVVTHVIPQERCWEIDEPMDVTVAEVLVQSQKTADSA